MGAADTSPVSTSASPTTARCSRSATGTRTSRPRRTTNLAGQQVRAGPDSGRRAGACRCRRPLHPVEIYADPWQLKRSMEKLRGRVRIEGWVFSQSSVRKLSATLLNAITTTTLRVYPDHELEREVTGLRVVDTPSGWRFDHRTGGYSDRAVALAMAILLAQERRHKGFLNTTASVVPRARSRSSSVRSGISGESRARRRLRRGGGGSAWRCRGGAAPAW